MDANVVRHPSNELCDRAQAVVRFSILFDKLN
jgi:hypothetical protein